MDGVCLFGGQFLSRRRQLDDQTRKDLLLHGVLIVEVMVEDRLVATGFA